MRAAEVHSDHFYVDQRLLPLGRTGMDQDPGRFDGDFAEQHQGRCLRFGRNPVRVDISPRSSFSVEPSRSPSDISFQKSVSFASKGWERSSSGLRSFRQSLHSRVPRIFQKPEAPRERLVLDPNGAIIRRWNQIFVAACLVAIFVDPLFFFLPVINPDDICVLRDENLAIFVTVLRTCTDVLFLVHILLNFRTAFVAPSSRVFGRGELVTDLSQIASRYMRKRFWLDVIAVLPYPQLVTWVFIPLVRMRAGSAADYDKNALRFFVLFNYLPRVYNILIILKSSDMSQHSLRINVVETAWAGAAYNLVFYLLASHVVGACWYLLAVERQGACWREACESEPGCDYKFLDCLVKLKDDYRQSRSVWLNGTSVGTQCSSDGPFNYGIFTTALQYRITTTKLPFLNKYFYCLWFGLLNLSSLCQSMNVTGYIWDAQFAIAVAVAGILLFALLIGNIQQYLQSVNLRLEEMRVRRRDTEQWMDHRKLPRDLRDRVRRHDQYTWVATRGVDEQNLLRRLPGDLRREIKRYLCLDLVKRVPLFNEMDDALLDAICEKLQPQLLTENSYLVREGDPVKQMVFVIRGRLESVTTDGGRTGFLNYETLGPGDFCGEELLTWALDPRPARTLPSSTRTVKGLTEVEGFSLKAEDLKVITVQFRKMHSKRVQHTFRYHSHQWRNWASCAIQAAWIRYQRRKAIRQERELLLQAEVSQRSTGVGATLFASMFAANAMRVVHRIRRQAAAVSIPVPKPSEPDFSDVQDN